MKEKRLRFLDEKSFEKLPPELREKKLEYHRKFNQIEKREKHLLKLKETYDIKRKELRRWKTEKTELYNNLFELHNELIPSTFSISYGGGLLESSGKSFSTKRWNEYNHSWNITMRIKGKLFTPYLGTDKVVRDRLNEIEDTDIYWDESKVIQSGRVQQIITNSIREKNKISEIIKSYTEPNIIEFLVKLNKNFNGFDEWCKLYKEKKIKGIDFLK